MFLRGDLLLMKSASKQEGVNKQVNIQGSSQISTEAVHAGTGFEFTSLQSSLQTARNRFSTILPFQGCQGCLPLACSFFA